MTRPSAGITPVCFSYILVIILLFESTRPVQSIALSSLCQHFGHSCFGGNWGKRDILSSALTPNMIQSNLNENDVGTTRYEKNSMDDYLLEKIRSNFLRHRLRQFLDLE